MKKIYMVILLISCICVAGQTKFEDGDDKKEYSGTETLAYSEEKAILITPKNKVEWNFNSSNPKINITLYRYTQLCYEKGSWHGTISENHTADSGVWDVPAAILECTENPSNTVPPFYFVFVNEDSDEEETILTYSLKIDPGISIPGYGNFISITLLALIMAGRSTKRKVDVQ